MNHFLSITVCAMIVSVAAPATASVRSDEMSPSLAVAALPATSSDQVILARRGADDPAGHDRGGQNRRGRGGSGRGGHDDGANHT